MSADDPLARALRRYLDPALARGDVLLAVSGGPDSTALMHVAAAFSPRVGLSVATVDHGLRPESREEAEGVAAAASRLGLPHHLLEWRGPKPASRVQAEARDARYCLLAQCAQEIGAVVVLTGHTQDDQAETVLMRLIAGSGPGGLAGMRGERPLRPGIDLARPFLATPKAALVAYCEAHGLLALQDPSNADDRFARVRLRGLMPLLAHEGLSVERLCRVALRAARDDAALTEVARSALAAARRSSEAGLILDGSSLRGLPEAILLRVVDAAIMEAGGTGPLRLERLERLVLDDLLPALRARTPLRRTLRGILIEVTPVGRLSFRLAPPRRAG
ncbi:tRNA(Ile)-lysidine synthase [Methylobacterium iners]|uniref:tRNA(Ile)-lysidine synthase n=1 Tax=Methylobacterium iners TaxID=418707 RepID=A0ABQ4RWC5_9HYPH|nr:tRNA lysidine(34) synthetase TilS [Methylobacterium iners]GJD94931.1 tRNA(Ile)-lysidine synthase [Methylobacterium iners]